MCLEMVENPPLWPPFRSACGGDALRRRRPARNRGGARLPGAGGLPPTCFAKLTLMGTRANPHTKNPQTKNL